METGTTVEKKVLLHLGCGRRMMPQEDGWVNIDFQDTDGKKPDVYADLRKLPFPDNHADEAHAIHVLEHFYFWEVYVVLSEWKRVLKPGGILVMELPDLERVARYIVEQDDSLNVTLFALYGDPRYRDPAMCHRWGYTKGLLAKILEDMGFIKIKFKPTLFHQQFKERDMRVQCVKPA